MVIFWGALLGGFNGQPRKAVIKFCLNIGDRVDILKLCPAAVDVTIHLCRPSTYESDREMKKFTDDTRLWVVSNNWEFFANGKSIGSYVAIEIGEAGQMPVIRGIQVQNDGEGLMVQVVDSAFLMNFHGTMIPRPSGA